MKVPPPVPRINQISSNAVMAGIKWGDAVSARRTALSQHGDAPNSRPVQAL